MDIAKVFHMNGGIGQNSYAKNSSIQKRASDSAKHITLKYLKDTYISTTPKSLGIADLGCSSGHNTLSTIREMVKAIDEIFCEFPDIPPPEYRVHLNDLPTNDFNSIFKILPNFHAELNRERQKLSQECDSNVYVAAYPGTFYGRLFPDMCLHFIHSSSSLHWLSKVPPGVYDKKGKSTNKGSVYITKASSPQVSKAYSDQFQEDFLLFLQSRSKELLAGGRMVLVLSGRRDHIHIDRGNSFFWELLSRSFAILVTQGKINQVRVDEYDTHFYASSKNELMNNVMKQGSFEIDHFKMFEMELKLGGSESYGTTIAKSTRAVQESVISHHFGEEIVDKLFEIYARLIDEEIVKEDIRPVGFIMVLKKM